MFVTRYSFIICFLLGVATGIGIFVTHLVAPEIVAGLLEGEQGDNVTAFFASLLIGSFGGFVLGLIVTVVLKIYSLFINSDK